MKYMVHAREIFKYIFIIFFIVLKINTQKKIVCKNRYFYYFNIKKYFINHLYYKYMYCYILFKLIFNLYRQFPVM